MGSDDDEDRRPSPGKVRLTGEGRAPALPPRPPIAPTQPAINLPGTSAPPGAPTITTANRGAGGPALPGVSPHGGQGASLADDQGEATVMLAKPVIPVPAGFKDDGESTRMLSGPLPGMHFAAPTGGTSQNESTQIGSLSNYADLPGMAQPGGGGGASAPTRGKLKPIAEVKAKHKVKIAPTDPQRKMFQQEAAERRASETSGFLEKVKDASGLFKLQGGQQYDAPAEGTMVGQFLGFAAFGDAQGGPIKDPTADTKEAAAASSWLTADAIT